MVDLKALQPHLRRELARRRFLDFATFVDPSYKKARHLRALADILERIERGELKRVIVTMPPRHGKSRTCSQLFPAWSLGRNPKREIVLAAYGSDLAEANSRRVRDIVSASEYPFDVTLREDSRAVHRWQTDQGGFVVAAGCGSALTGFGADLLVIDDIVRDRESADSAIVRESTWAWYQDVARTRLHPSGAQIIVGTRWHDDDFIGRLLATPGWEVLSLPAIADENDPLGRVPGEVLWPERFPLDELPSAERGEISSRSFSALYQQRPAPAKGSLFNLDWFDRRYAVVPTRTKPVRVTTVGSVQEITHDVFVIQAIDAAAKTGVANDYSVIVTLAFDDADVYLVDIARRRVQFAELVAMVRQNAHRYAPSVVYIEDASNGTPVIQALRSQSSLPIVPVTPKGSKTSRAEAVTPWCESRRVILPERASWLDAFVDEVASFPLGRHDDQVDAFVLALTMLGASIQRRDETRRQERALFSWFDR